MDEMQFKRYAVLFLVGFVAVAAAVWFRTSRSSPAFAKDVPTLQESKIVKVKVFNKDGELVGPVPVKKIDKTEAEWREQLDSRTFEIVREHGTERAGTGELLSNKADGVYSCVACGLPLYEQKTKFESGTGWPSFYAAITEGNVGETRDTSYGMVRTEIHCARCNGHLGHVFDDGPKPTGLRHCVNSASLAFTPKDQLSSLADPAADAPKAQTAVFAGGCFWCTEAVFEQLEGVLEVVSGYAGGSADSAKYDRVSAGVTEHAEVIQITYDPSQITYDKLLEVFFTVAHDPTQLNKQGPDHGKQYRSAVFYADDAQKQATEAYIKQLEAEKVYSDPIVTTLEPLTQFHPAEQYHQDYVRLNPNQPYVRYNALPKVDKVRKKFDEIVKPTVESK